MSKNIIKKDHARTHEENRFVVCLLCCSKNKTMINIKDSLRKKIYELFDDYDHTNECLPKVVCPSCKSNLYRSNLDKTKILQIKFSKYSLKKQTRSQKFEKTCGCDFCEIARKHGMDKIIPKNVFSTNRKAVSSKSRKTNKTMKCCCKCMRLLKKGKSHLCVKSKVITNVNECIKDFNLKTKEQLTSTLIKDVTRTNGASSSITVKLSQPQGGAPLQISVGQPKQLKKT